MTADREAVAKIIDPGVFVTVEERIDRTCTAYDLNPNSVQLRQWKEADYAGDESRRQAALTKADAILAIVAVRMVPVTATAEAGVFREEG